MFKRDVLYYENRIQLLSSKDAQANRALINKCMRKLRNLKKEGEINEAGQLGSIDSRES